jgi:hypothetical protein
MAIKFELNPDEGIVTFHYDAPATMDDYQADFSNALKEIEAAGISRWLLVLEFDEPASDQRARAFNESVAQEINRYITKIAVVCPLQWHARLSDVLEPISNQGKPVGLFQTIDEAQNWLKEAN